VSVVVGFFSLFYPFASVMALSEATYPSGRHTTVYPCSPGSNEYQLYVDYPWYSDYFYQQEPSVGTNTVQEKVYSGSAYSKTNCSEDPSTGGSVSVSYSYTLSMVTTAEAEIATKLNILSNSIVTSLGTTTSWSFSTSSSTTVQLSGSYDWGTVGANTKKWITPYVYIRTTTGAKYAYNDLDACLYNWTLGHYCGTPFTVVDIYSKTTETISYPVELGVEENSASGCSSSPTLHLPKVIG
jgi:hypothetical protein